ncbi:LysR family transcriptional regulator [Devosia salina]|uniref:LysR family transcriptional regulator n=1 Tax=Devosia salina TaxID=2860336 RepID=A0ABX8WGC2_9HYPH|nr:LysR family transcriptional regulator [Devosia salina]QYO76041.1 LysR family transcriptional regulator [Devosia salina]
MDWDDVRVFLSIARNGTLGAAARDIGQTQPTLGRRLRGLEQAVGQTLFQRSSNGFVLTEAGQSVLATAEQMEEQAVGFARILAGQENGLSGLLRVSSSDWFGAQVLTPVFSDFCRTHPNVTIELITDARRLDLSRRDADLVFRNVQPEEPDIVQRKLIEIDYGFYGIDRLPPPEAGDGAGCPLVTMDTGFADLPDMDWLRTVLPNAHPVYRSNNREAQAVACAAGVGFAVLPRILAERMPQLKAINLGSAPPGRTMWLAYHRDLRHLARLRALLEHTIAALV